MAKVLELDVTFSIDKTADEIVAELIDGTKVTATLIDSERSGSGWPIYRFEGPAFDLAFVVARYVGADANTLVNMADVLGLNPTFAVHLSSRC